MIDRLLLPRCPALFGISLSTLLAPKWQYPQLCFRNFQMLIFNKQDEKNKNNCCVYWVVQGLLTPLTVTWNRLSPLAVFTSGAYFLHNGRQ